MSGVLNARQIRNLIESPAPMVTDFVDLANQMQPSGMDLTLREVRSFASTGKLTCANSGRRISETAVLEYDERSHLHLPPGAFLVTYNEVVNLPLDVMALALPRSSLLRSGVSIQTAVWDPGYSGRAQSMMTVFNTSGFIVEKNARIVQLVFFKLELSTTGYNGSYQGENLD
jgi:dUTP pyrophosphatase